jgi:hypothetical protein
MQTAASTATQTVASTATSTASATPVATSTGTATVTATASQTATVTQTPSISPSPTITPFPVVIQIGDASGNPGNVVGFAVTIATRDQSVAGANLCIGYDATTPVDAPGGQPDCNVPLDSDKQGLFRFEPTGCTPGTDCVRVCAEIGGSTTPFDNGATLFSCRVAIAADAPLDEFPLTCSAASASGPQGQPIVTECTDGTVVVQINIPGDCDGDGIVTINELILGVNIALGNLPVTACPAFDTNRDGQVSIDELIAAVNAALSM